MTSPLRSTALVVIALACAAGCGRTRSLQSADPEQSIADRTNEAQGDVGGVVVRAALGGWRGDPRDLEQKLTPVDVLVQNGSRQPIRLGPEAFGLVVDDHRLRVLTRDEVSRAVAQLAAFRGNRPPRAGAVGGPTFPGYDVPGSPYGPGSGSPANSPVPSARGWHHTQPPSGELEPGRRTSVLLFFETPARTLRSATFEVDVVTQGGEKVGTIRLPFETEE